MPFLVTIYFNQDLISADKQLLQRNCFVEKINTFFSLPWQRETFIAAWGTLKINCNLLTTHRCYPHHQVIQKVYT